MKGQPYTERDLGRLVRLHIAGVSRAEMASALGRSVASIEDKITELRRAGRIPDKSHNFRIKADIGCNRIEPCILLNGDDALVEMTIAEGGFPVAVLGQGWRNLAGQPWQHTPDEDRRAA